MRMVSPVAKKETCAIVSASMALALSQVQCPVIILVWGKRELISLLKVAVSASMCSLSTKCRPPMNA